MSKKQKYEDVNLPYPNMRQRILLALRAGGMESHELHARLGSGYSGDLKRMVAMGLVTKASGTNEGDYTLTAQGRAACPRWRDVVRPCAVSANEFAPTGEVEA